MIRIDEPYDEYETELIRIIQSIQEEANRQIKPFLDQLCASRQFKHPRYVMDPSDIPIGALNSVIESLALPDPLPSA